MSLKALAAKQQAAKKTEPLKQDMVTQGRTSKGVAGSVSGGSTPSPAPDNRKRGLVIKGKLSGSISTTRQPSAKVSGVPAVVEQESSQAEVNPQVTDPPSEPLSGEIPATECERDLPDDMTDSMKEFIKLVDRIPSLFTDAELMGQTLRRIMTDMQNNKEFMGMLIDSDIRNIIKGFKDTLGGAQIKKAATKKKTSNRKTKPKLDANDMGDLDSLLADMGI